MKIKTITCHNVYNVGASLQAYALLTYLKGLGHEVEIIDYQPGYLSDRHNISYVPNEKYRNNIVLKYAYLLCKIPVRLKELPKKNIFDKFHDENYTLTDKTYRNNEELKLNPPIADIYFAGSDQIWNTIFENGKDPAFYLDFAPKESIKASYAASFATEKVDDKYIKTFLSLQKQVPFFEVMLNTFNQRTSMGSTDALSIIYRDIIITLFRDMLWNEESELLQYTMGTFAEVENFNYTLEKIVEKYNWGENF